MCPPDRLAGAQFAVYIRRMPWYIIAPTINSKTNFDFVPRAKRAEDKRPPPLPRLSLSPSLGHFFQIFSLTSNSCFEYIYVYIRKRAELGWYSRKEILLLFYEYDDSFPIIWFGFFWFLEKFSRFEREKKIEKVRNGKQLVLSDSDLIFGKTLEPRKTEEVKEREQKVVGAVWFGFGFWKNSRDSKERWNGGNRKQLMLSDSDLVFGKTLETRKREEMEKVGNGKQLMLSDSDLVFGKTLETRKREEDGENRKWQAVWFEFGFWKNSRNSKMEEARNGK